MTRSCKEGILNYIGMVDAEGLPAEEIINQLIEMFDFDEDYARKLVREYAEGH